MNRMVDIDLGQLQGLHKILTKNLHWKDCLHWSPGFAVKCGTVHPPVWFTCYVTYVRLRPSSSSLYERRVEY